MTQRWIYSIALLIGLQVTLVTGNHAQAQEAQLQTATDLESLGEQAQDRRVPILIMFSSDSCPYCTIMEEGYLLPMLRNAEYKNKVIIRKIMVNGYDTLTDFNGKRIEAEDLPGRYRAWVTPTLVFLNSDGKEIAPKLVGIGTEGFFAGDIDNAIDMALTHLRSVALK